MKKICNVLALLFMVSLAFQAQSQSIHIQGGLNLANMAISFDDDDDFDDFDFDTDWKLGFVLGATALFPVTDLIELETGFLFSQKGFKYSDEYEFYDDFWDETETEKYKLDVRLLYLNIPITARANFNFGDNAFFLQAGPYVGVGLTGTFKTEFEYSYNGFTESGKFEDDIEWGSGDDDDYKRLDYGLLFGAGIEFGRITFGVSYGLGLADIAPYDDATEKNKVLSFRLGYKINFMQ